MLEAQREENGPYERLLVCVELASGEVVGKELCGGSKSWTSLIAGDGRIMHHNFTSGRVEYFQAAPDFRTLEFRQWQPPGTFQLLTWRLVDGRLFMREKEYSRIYCYDLRAAVPPRASLPGGKYAQPVAVELTHPEPEATIRYTVDNTRPTRDAPVYDEPLQLAETTIVKARAFVPQRGPSRVLREVYYFGEADRAAAPTIEPDPGEYSRDLTVQLTTPTRYATIRYTLDGSEPTADAPAYAGPFVLARSAELRAKTFCGHLSDSPVALASYQINRQPFTATDGRIVMEAENYFTQKQADPKGWVAVDADGAVGQAVDAHPGLGAKYDPAKGPRLDYPVLIPAAGDYHVWVRWRGRGSSSDSFYLGHDGEVDGEVGDHSGDFAWSRLGGDEAQALDIDRTGQHTVHLWMRETGTQVDRLILTTDADYQPTGEGPAESPQKKAE